jgi:hypothetical protein
MQLSMISSIYMFQDFFEGKLEIYGLNCGVLTSIPNKDKDDTMNKFRIMSLLDWYVKIYTKVVTNMIATITNIIIDINQYAINNGRYILENVVAAHKIIHYQIFRNSCPFLN